MNESLKWKEWKAGDAHLINRAQWGEPEVQALQRVLSDDWLGDGKANREFEGKLSAFTGISHFNLTNSGSAALQVAMQTLRHTGRFTEGGLVLHPVTTFATSISSTMFFGGVPVFIETTPQTFVADPSQVERAVKQYPEIEGMVLPHLLGNIPDMDRIKKALGPNRFLLEDCCDTLGGTYKGKHVGSFGDFAAFSFYGSHHVTAGGVGGAIATNNPEYARLAKSLIFWGRDYSAGQDFLKRYQYETIGTDSQMTSLQAAFGSAQMDRLPGFVSRRKAQFERMSKLIGDSGYFEMPRTDANAQPSWFSFPLLVREDAPFKRQAFVDYLVKNKVEIRPIMCGNLLKQAPFAKLPHRSLDGDKFPIGDAIDARGLFLPCWGMAADQQADYERILKTFFAQV